MTAYLLTWNPKITDWVSYVEDRKKLLDKGFLDGRWSCGRTKRIQKGDRIYLLRQGLEPKGIVAYGYARSASFSALRWNDSSRTCNYIKVRWNMLQDFINENIISRKRLSQIGDVYWDTQMSGILIPAEVDNLLVLELANLNKVSSSLPEELPILSSPYVVDAAERVLVNRYERDPQARKECIRHYMRNNRIKCEVCNFDFSTIYGEIGNNFIHIHHIVPISKLKKRYKLNPIQDLVPVSANCHAMLHRAPLEPFLGRRAETSDESCSLDKAWHSTTPHLASQRSKSNISYRRFPKKCLKGPKR